MLCCAVLSVSTSLEIRPSCPARSIASRTKSRKAKTSKIPAQEVLARLIVIRCFERPSTGTTRTEPTLHVPQMNSRMYDKDQGRGGHDSWYNEAA